MFVAPYSLLGRKKVGCDFDLDIVDWLSFAKQNHCSLYV